MEDKRLGREKNSIGFWRKDEIWIDRNWFKFEHADGYYFEGGDFVGIGIILHPNAKIECFATCNGKLLGKII